MFQIFDVHKYTEISYANCFCGKLWENFPLAHRKKVKLPYTFIRRRIKLIIFSIYRLSIIFIQDFGMLIERNWFFILWRDYSTFNHIFTSRVTIESLRLFNVWIHLFFQKLTEVSNLLYSFYTHEHNLFIYLLYIRSTYVTLYVTNPSQFTFYIYKSVIFDYL